MKAKSLSRLILPVIVLSGLFFFCGEGPTSPYLAPYKITVSNNGPHYVGVELSETVTIEGEGLDSITISPDLPDSLKLDSTFSSQKGTVRGIPWAAIDRTFRITAHNQHGTKEIEWRLVVEDTNAYLDVTSNLTEAGTVTLNPEPDYYHPTRNWYRKGITVSATATPSDGYKFSAWTGSVTSDQRTIDVELTETKSLQAVFVEASGLTVVTSVQPPDGGIVTLSPDKASYEKNASVTARATPADGYTFVRWEGSATGANPTVSMEVTKDLSLTALFSKASYTLMIEKIGTGTILLGNESTTPAGNTISVESGDTIYLSAQPGEGYVFGGWSGAVSGTANPVSLVISKDSAKVTGIFTREGTVTINGTISPEFAGNVTITPRKDSYEPNETVGLKAIPAEGYRFKQWQGDITGTLDTVTLTMDQSKLYTAIFEPVSYRITVTIEGEGSITPVSPINSEYGKTETLTATPGYGYKFAGWSGDAEGILPELSLLMDGNKNVAARFEPIDTFAVMVAANPAGGGTFTITPQKDTYSYGEEIIVEAAPADGYSFSSWSGSSNSDLESIRLTVDGNINLTGKFSRRTYYVTVEKEGEGTIEPSNSPIEAHYGNEVTLSANPAEGHSFYGWAGDAEGSDNPLTLSVTKSVTVKAVFIENDKYVVVTSVSPADAGTVTRIPDQSTFEKGDIVELSASPKTGYEFVEWRSQDTTMSVSTFTLTVDTSYSLTAVFRAKKYSVTINAGEGGSISRSASGKIAYGETLTLTAVPATGHKFISWGNDASGETNPYELTVDGTKTVSATFAKIDTFTISKTVNPPERGTIVLDPSGPTYEYEQEVTVTANPHTGYRLKNWGGDLSSAGSSESTILTITRSHSVSATFEKIPCTVTVEIQGSGTVTPSSGTHTIYHGDQMTFTATPADGYKFDGWSGGITGKETPKTVTITGDVTVRAVFSRNDSYTIVPSVTPNGSGSVTKSPDKTSYTYEESVTLTAVPNEGYTFVKWENGLNGTAETKSYTVTQSIQPRAVFEKKTYTLTVNDDGHGTVSPSGDVTLEHGESRSISASPSSNYDFDKWTLESGDAEIANAGSRNTTVSITSNATIKAGFKLQPKTATPTISPSGGVYQNDVTVSISCATSGATIHYTTDNTTPTTGSPEYTGSFKLTSDAVVRALAVANSHRSSSEASVSYTVNQPPTISITSPTDGDVVGGSVSFQVDPSDPDGVVDKVEFERFGSVLGMATSASGWSWSWDGAPVGTHTITAKAYDNNGAFASASVTFSYAQWQKLATIPASPGSKHISLAMPGTGDPYVTTLRIYDDNGEAAMDRKLYHHSGGSWRSWDNSPMLLNDTVLFYPVSVSENDYMFSAYPDHYGAMLSFFHPSLTRYDPSADSWEVGGSADNESRVYEPHVGIGSLSGSDQAIAAYCDPSEDAARLNLYKYSSTGWDEMPQSWTISANRHDKIWIAGFPDDAYLLLENGDCFNLTSDEALEKDIGLSGGKGLAVSGENVYALDESNGVYRIASGTPIRIKNGVSSLSPIDASIAGDETGVYFATIEAGNAVVKKYVNGNWINFPIGSNGVVSSEAGLEEIEISVKDGQIAVAVVCNGGVYVYKLLK